MTRREEKINRDHSSSFLINWQSFRLYHQIVTEKERKNTCLPKDFREVQVIFGLYKHVRGMGWSLSAPPISWTPLFFPFPRISFKTSNQIIRKTYTKNVCLVSLTLFSSFHFLLSYHKAQVSCLSKERYHLTTIDNEEHQNFLFVSWLHTKIKHKQSTVVVGVFRGKEK